MVDDQARAIIHLLVENIQESEVEVIQSTDYGISLKISGMFDLRLVNEILCELGMIYSNSMFVFKHLEPYFLDGRKWSCRYVDTIEGSAEVSYHRDKITITVTKKDLSKTWERLNVETSVKDPSRLYELTQVKDSFYDKVTLKILSF